MSIAILGCSRKTSIGTVHNNNKSQKIEISENQDKLDIESTETNIVQLQSFDGSLMNAIEEAAKINKKVFVDVMATWCAPCRVMDEEVFSRNDVRETINKNYVYYKVNGEKGNGPAISQIYEVKMYPTLLILDSNGIVISRNDGALSGTKLIKFLK